MTLIFCLRLIQKKFIYSWSSNIEPTEMKGRIPELNVVSKTLEGLLALYIYNVPVGPIAAVYPQEG